jgi:signal transduction histidine kinase
MLEIITNQLKRKEGSETFLGYWLYDTRDTPSKKLSVYVPALIDSGLLIISSIIDYDEVLRPVKAMYAKITVLVVAISLVFIGLIVYLHYTGIRKEETEKENRYLRELNRTLQLVNENQRVENHQQRLEIIGTMTCGIAHEFNNLLTPIMGYSGMLLSKIDEHDKEWEDIKEIYDASEKAKEIIQQISAFGRKNSDMTFHHISVQHFFKQLQKLATGLMSNTINFICIPPEQEYYIFGNATQLTQVVLNMIVNAIDAIGKQEGEITLSFHLDPSLKELPAVETSEGKLNMYACIQVTDTGCGMDKSTQKQIFNPFFTTKGNQGGHGLGLLISKNIVTTHHGKILSTSELQKGSTFTIRLPLSKKPSKSPKKTTISSLQEKKPIVWDILIVNEDPIALRQIAKSLSKRVYLVTKLHNSLDALTQLNQHSYTVLVVDDALTQITWGELSMKARQLRPSLTTVLLTNTISEEVINAVSTGILDGYLLKPSSGNELEEKILDVVKYKY